MGDKDAGKAVNAERFIRTGKNEGRIQNTLPAPDGDDAEGANDDRQTHRHRHQPDDPDPSRKLASPGKRQRHRQAKNNGKKGGKCCLIKRETQDAQRIGIHDTGSRRARIKRQEGRNGERHE
ncbi:hypothetical protein D3C72_1243610 [compost metagenome]